MISGYLSIRWFSVIKKERNRVGGQFTVYMDSQSIDDNRPRNLFNHSDLKHPQIFGDHF